MYLHIGKDKIIKLKDLIMIYNIYTIGESEGYREIVQDLKSKHKLSDISEGIQKSLLLVKEKNEIKAYISNISTETLVKRAKR